MALRITGSVIGEPITSSSSSATGMWLSQEVAALQQDGIWQIAPGFTLTSSAATVNEGASITITLTTTGIPNGTAVPYVISGANIFANDSANGVITGNFVIQNNSNTISFAANADLLTEGLEAFTITAGGASTSVTINDTSNAIVDSDAQFPYTTLALHGNGTNNSQNNTFLDSSTNNFSITRNGNSTQGTFSPYGGNWSNYFDGTGDYLTTPTSSSLGMGSGDFTIELWVYATSPTYAQGFFHIDATPIGPQVSGYAIGITAAGAIEYYSGATYTTTSSTITANRWNHLALVRSAGTVKVYVNGILPTSGGSIADSQNLTTALAHLGVFYALNYPMVGYISNFRVVKGTAIYTTNFTPPTAPLTAIAGTSLLTCQDNRLIDDSPNNFTITKNGDVSVQRFSPFSPVTTTPTSYGVRFTSTSDNFSMPYDIKLNLYQSICTIECWLYLSSYAGGGANPCIYGHSVWDGGSTYTSLHLTSGGNLRYRTREMTAADSTSVVPLNQWAHVAFVRSGTSGSTYTFYINGVAAGTGSMTGRGEEGWDTNLRIGISNFNADRYLDGNISNLRVVKGIAVYTGAFTPPTGPLTATQSSGTNISAITGTETSLLTCQSPTAIDNSTNAFPITTAGGTKLTTLNPFGFTNTASEYSTTTFGGSGYFDGSGDYLTTASISSFGTGSFTVEAWVYVTAVPTGGYDVFTTADGSFPAGLMRVFINNSLQPEYFDGTNVATSSVSISLNTWNHIAITRTSGTARVYVNGIQTASVASSNNQTGTTGYIGKTWNNYYYFGYISNFRLVKGTAVYQSNFAPPIAPVTAVANTQLLCNFTNAGIIDNAMMNNLETIADAKISTTQSKFGGTSMSFDGTGDYLSTYNPSYSLSVGSGDFTYECWLYVNALPGLVTSVYHLKNDTGLATTVFVLELTTNGAISISTGTAIIAYGTAGKITTGSWIHFACVRTSGVFKTFFNGIQDISVANTTAYNGTYLFIGAWRYSSYDNSLNGYIDDIRITKGYARYTSNFTPPTNQLAGK